MSGNLLSMRKMRRPVMAVSSSFLFALLHHRHYSVDRTCRCQFPVYWSHRSVCGTSDSSSSNLKTLNAFSSLKDRLMLFSTMAGTILVQARDPAKLNMEILNAIDERRYIDTWKLYEQHMQMEGFPRKSVVNRLLTGFAESLDVQWLEKAYGVVEQAFEESKQNLLEKEPLIYLSLGLAKCSLSVPASTILRKLVETENFPPVTAWSAILAHVTNGS